MGIMQSYHWCYAGMLLSKIRYESYKKLILHNEKLEEERNELRTESCLYELLQKEVQPQDELWNKCLESKIYINRKYKFLWFCRIIFLKIKGIMNGLVSK